MRRLGQLLLASALAWLPSASAAAEVVDFTRTVTAAGSIGASASLTVVTALIGSNAPQALNWGAVTGVTPTVPWKVAPQYMAITHSSNAANWAIRVLTNNKSAFPTLAGKVLDAKVIADPNDDILGYAGMIGSTPADPNNRIPWVWQAFQNTLAAAPTAPVDNNDNGTIEPNEVGGEFNAPWAFIADLSDCPSTATNCRSAAPATIDDTIEYLRIAQGDSSNAFLLLHPETPPRTSDGTIAVYLAARFGGASADTYRSTIIVELYHF